MELEQQPLSLYSQAVSSLTSPITFSQVLSRKDLIPQTVLLDIFSKKVTIDPNPKDIKSLHNELCQLETFTMLLSTNLSRKDCVRRVWNAVIDGVIKKDTRIVGREEVLPCRLASSFQMKISGGQTEKLIERGKMLGVFLYDMGWFKEAATVFQACLGKCQEGDDDKQTCFLLARLLSAQVRYSLYTEAKATRTLALSLINKLKQFDVVELAELYSAMSRLYTYESEYTESFNFSLKALAGLRTFPEHYTVHHGATLEILCQGAISCHNVMDFNRANILIKGALRLSKDVYGSKSTAYADVLHVYGKYLWGRNLNVLALEAYTECCNIRRAAHNIFNLVTAVTKQDLSYLSLINDDGTLDCYTPRCSLRRSFAILNILLPPTHLQFATINVLKVTFLHHQASNNPSTLWKLESEKLLVETLHMLVGVFGERSLEVGKHFGCLGKFYRLMDKHSEAQEALLKGISILDSASFRGSYEWTLLSQLGLLARVFYTNLENTPEGRWEKAEPVYRRAVNICNEYSLETFDLIDDLYEGHLLNGRENLEIYDMEEALILENQRREEAENDEIKNLSLFGLSTVLENFLT